VQNLFSGVASLVGGLLITQNAAGKVVGYGNAGWLAMGATLITLFLVGRIRLHALPSASNM